MGKHGKSPPHQNTIGVGGKKLRAAAVKPAYGDDIATMAETDKADHLESYPYYQACCSSARQYQNAPRKKVLLIYYHIDPLTAIMGKP